MERQAASEVALVEYQKEALERAQEQKAATNDLAAKLNEAYEKLQEQNAAAAKLSKERDAKHVKHAKVQAKAMKAMAVDAEASRNVLQSLIKAVPQLAHAVANQGEPKLVLTYAAGPNEAPDEETVLQSVVDVLGNLNPTIDTEMGGVEEAEVESEEEDEEEEESEQEDYNDAEEPGIAQHGMKGYTVECNNTSGQWNLTYSNRCRLSAEEEVEWEEQHSYKEQQHNTTAMVWQRLTSVVLARRTQRFLGREYASVHKARRKKMYSSCTNKVETVGSCTVEEETVG